MRAQAHPPTPQHPIELSHAAPSLPAEARKCIGDDPSDIAGRIARLETMQPEELRAEWKRLYRSQPPKLSRDLMVRALAYRVQEIVHGGLRNADVRKLAAMAVKLKAGGRIIAHAPVSIRPGARLVREWHGRTHSVSVTNDGYLYRGQTYRSLTSIAREITGARWSGPRFFGLHSGRSSSSPATANRDGAELAVEGRDE